MGLANMYNFTATAQSTHMRHFFKIVACRYAALSFHPKVPPHKTSEDCPRGQDHSADPHASPKGRTIITLEAELLSGAGGDAALDAARAELGVRVRDAREGPLGGRVGGPAEVDVVDDGVADHVAVGRVDCLCAAVLEDGRLDQELRVLAGVDAGVDGGEVAAVRGGIMCGQPTGRREIGGRESSQVFFGYDLLEDVAGSESERWGTRVYVAPVVVGVGDVQVAGVFITVRVGVADQGGLVL